MKQKYPHDAEVLNYSNYVVEEKHPSKFVKDLFIYKDEGFTCPSCEKFLKKLGHGEYTKCECGLKMQLFGNGLHIWR